MFFKPSSRVIDNTQCGFITALGRCTPGEKSMRTEHDANQFWITRSHRSKLQTQIKTRSLPWQISNLSTKHFRCEFFRVLCRRNGNHRVSMHMINMSIGYKTVQGRVDRSGTRIEIERAMIEHAHHRVFLRNVFVYIFEAIQLVHVKRGKTIEFHRANITTRTLDP